MFDGVAKAAKQIKVYVGKEGLGPALSRSGQGRPTISR